MPRKYATRVCLCLVAVLQIFSADASAGFAEVMQITVPGISNIDEFDFGDIDFDGTPEILVNDWSTLVLYSPQSDSVLYRNDDFLIPDAMSYKILLDDANRDAVPDLVTAQFSYSMALASHMVTIDGLQLSLGAVDSIYVDRPAGLFVPGDFGIESLLAVDIDGDGHNELMLSYDSTYGTSWDWYTTGRLQIYHSFPDSLIYEEDCLLGAPLVFKEGPDWYLAGNRYTQEYHELGPGATVTDYASLGFVSTENGFTEAVLSKGIHSGNLNAPLCAGNIHTGISGTELLSIQNQYNYSDDGPPPYEYFVYGSMHLYTFVPPSSLVEIWTMTDVGGLPSTCSYLPDFPGSFFGFRNGWYIQFDGSNGAAVDSFDVIPVGRLYWRNIFGDDQPYLIAVNGNTVTIYQPGIPTAADDIPADILPDLFSVGAPYPNPFNASQTIPITVRRPGVHLEVDVYNILGEKVDAIFSGSAGSTNMTITWNAVHQASGIYFIKATTDSHSQVVKTILLK